MEENTALIDVVSYLWLELTIMNKNNQSVEYNRLIINPFLMFTALNITNLYIIPILCI